jgi:HD-GYP domain-containing protein (c-di-GMP phosphodiesterase class II)
MPLCNVSDGHPIGVFQVINKLSGTTFTSEDVDLLSHVSLYASSTIEGALLNERLRRAHRDVIYKLSSATKFKDPETQNHIIRVGLYCAAIAQKLGWSEEQIETIRLAAPMHDIGKVGIPDAILQKPGPLTEDEWIIMRKHTEYGYNILDGSDSSLLAMAKELALDHHEKWDGSGYPNNKSGDKISLAGRITALADVFDALTSPRHYKPAWTTPRVTAHIAEQNGKHFDPDLTVIFLNNIDIMTKIRAEWQDPELIVTTVAPA